ncbi:MBL fold metallo-hydrolase [Dyadobacter subterraneus]|uniref:MBL fold metallo-hydrolase n=1 Tax=Dyadobacter subterraneus TaxID=2773304 RepID=A0ABR9WCP0_9BACT|nr:MBL fold metallo-hydrolase [Dyadobacter subterraneus]MBE9463241.1 MBL fold metallo-hydrolase [Dyadobacter subterraneus]
MEIFPIEEGIYNVDKEKNLTILTEVNKPVPESIRMAVRPFLIKLKNDVVLLDCGLGIRKQGSFMITSLLKQHGIEANQITKILLSHLHKDHVEGLGYFQDGLFVQHFPNASVYVNRQELEYSLMQRGNPSYNYNLLFQLSVMPNLQIMTELQGYINPEISFEVVGGHTPYHQAFWISEMDETIFYGGDNLPQAHYLDFPIAYKTDYDGRKARELRQLWERQAKSNHWKILLYHDLILPKLTY